MKKVVFGILLGILVILFGIALLTLNGRLKKSKDLENGLNKAVRESLQTVIESKDGASLKDEELEALVKKQLEKRLKTRERKTQDANYRLDLTIRVSDPKKGVLSCEAEEHYTHPNGKVGVLHARSTAIVERQVPQKMRQVTFYLPTENGKSIYKQYMLPEGSDFPEVGDPTLSGKRFSGWEKLDGSSVDLPDTVSQDEEYLGRFTEG